MREPIRDAERLAHMLDSIDTVTGRFSDYTEQEIERDPIIYFGFVKHLEIMGEAAYKLSKELKENNPQVDWRVIEGLRHVLVHGYYKILPQEIFNTIKNDLSKIREQISAVYKAF